MCTRPLRPTLVLGLACLLAVLLFLLGIAAPGAHFWGRFLIPIVVVFLWGRRRDIYLITALASALIVASYWLDPTPGLEDLVVNHLLPLAVLWAAAWLLAQRRQMEEELAAQRQELLRAEQELERQVAARTAELQASERRYRDLFDHSPDMYLAGTADDHVIRECNRTLAHALGYTPEELIGQPTSLLLTPAFYAAVQAGWSEYVAAGDFANNETQLVRKDGTVLDVLVSGHFDPATGDSPAYSRVTFRDITERRQAEEAQRRSQEQLAKIFRANPGGIAITRLSDSCCVEANDAFLAVVGFTREELIGHSFVDLGIMSAADRTALRATFGELGYTHGLDMQVTNAQGEAVDVLYSLEQIDFNGEPCYLGLVVDITARKRAEAQLAASEARLRAVIENTEDRIWSVDHEYRLLVANSEFARSIQQQTGRPFALGEQVTAAPYPPGVRVFWQSLYDRAFAGQRFMLEMQSDQDSASTLACYMNPIFAEDGTVAGTSVRVANITDLKHYQQLLQNTNAVLEQRVADRTTDLEAALAELQAANRLKDDFMAMISHELRTPLTGVLSLSELLEEQIAGPLNERQAKYVRGINESGERLLYVINGILSYTHLLSGKLQLRREPCDLGYLVHVCAVSQRAKAETKQQVVEEVIELAGLSVESDAEAIGEVLKRLLDNAIKFTPPGGRIGLAAHGGPGPGPVQLVVWDTGPGIGGEQLERLVKPFAQGDASLARGYEGIGMGLAYVDAMVRLLGGTLAVAPNPGGGSRFTITLPRATPDAAPAPGYSPPY